MPCARSSLDLLDHDFAVAVLDVVGLHEFPLDREQEG